tara:strand:+ start:11084 stop:11359 length:276 start_codon:yes stop_codon:yes gene_type:complete
MNIKELKENIESLDIHQQIQIGKILYDDNISMFENKNGVFVNLTDVNEDTINKVNKLLQHIKEQELSFKDQELKKQEYKDNYFTNINEVCD